jgi:FkbM family methyltransferase
MMLSHVLGIGGASRVIAARLKGLGTVYVKPKNSSQPILVRLNNSDLPTLSEVFCSSECELTLPWRPKTILDLGANIGLTSIKLKRQFPDAILIAVEADRGSAEICRVNLERLPHTRVLHKAIGWGSGTVKCVNPTVPSTSRRFEFCAATDSGAVDEIRINDLLHQYHCQPPILIKMDIEGAEASCFEHGDTWLPAVRGILVEAHSKDLSDTIKTSLREWHFTVDYVGEKIFGNRAV